MSNERFVRGHDLVKGLAGCRRIERHPKGDDFHGYFDSDVVGHYDGLRQSTIELGPIRFHSAGLLVEVYVAADSFIGPEQARDELTRFDLEKLQSAIFKEPYEKLQTTPPMIVRRYRTTTDRVTEPKVHPHQWVEHPNWGRGQVQGFVLFSPHDATVRFDGGGVQVVDHRNLTPAVHLGPRWAFEFAPPRGRQQMSASGRAAGEHVRVVVRSGTPGSRALLGQLVMTADEAADLRFVVEKMGAAVSDGTGE